MGADPVALIVAGCPALRYGMGMCFFITLIVADQDAVALNGTLKSRDRVAKLIDNHDTKPLRLWHRARVP